MSDTKEAYESGKAVGRCQGAREMELAIALDNKAASLRINQQPQPKICPFAGTKHCSEGERCSGKKGCCDKW